MGRIVEVIKLKTKDEIFIHYSYRLIDNEFLGELKIHKNTGEILMERLAQGDAGSRFYLAASALRKCWDNGELPEKTYWTS